MQDLVDLLQELRWTNEISVHLRTAALLMTYHDSLLNGISSVDVIQNRRTGPKNHAAETKVGDWRN